MQKQLGSPPLARGKEVKIGPYTAYARITPACAGKRPASEIAPCGLEDHPRLRGEKLPPKSSSSQIRGSPPLARGKVPISRQMMQRIRITPACAGKRPGIDKKGSIRGDHPRLRGEDIFNTGAYGAMAGSPPLARGKGSQPAGSVDDDRITPACAGKSVPWHRRGQFYQDHPRLRGETWELAHSRMSTAGSPPLARGKSIHLIIQRVSLWDHPRLRGEKDRLVSSDQALEGSPPLARGKVEIVNRSGAFRRDHPRLRGEKPSGWCCTTRTRGSPPLARGKAFSSWIPSRCQGITPACAGKS